MAAIPFPRVIPFARMLGFELLRFADGEAEIAIEVREELSNSWGVAHGGMMMTLLDVCMAHAARAPLTGAPAVEDRGAVTIEMKTSFLKPGLGRLVARGSVLRRSPSLLFCEGRIVDGEGELVAHATGTFKVLRGLPVGGRRVHSPNASD